jgi:catechol 2,3-dioxygenase-like lactoylglutathione lyase family enzyme
MRPQPMITCSSVSVSSAWYQRVLGFESTHGGDEYEMLMADGALVLQLHEVDAHEHPALVREGEPLGGNGVALWFETTEYRDALDRIRLAGDEIDVVVAEDDHANPLAHHRETWLRDPDSYVVVVSSPYGDVE